MARASETLGYLLADGSPKVVKRVIQACTSMLITAFIEATSHPRARHAKVCPWLILVLKTPQNLSPHTSLP